MLMENAVIDQMHAVMAGTALKIHVAIICDGNGRWATSRGLPRNITQRPFPSQMMAT